MDKFWWMEMIDWCWEVFLFCKIVYESWCWCSHLKFNNNQYTNILFILIFNSLIPHFIFCFTNIHVSLIIKTKSKYLLIVILFILQMLPHQLLHISHSIYEIELTQLQEYKFWSKIIKLKKMSSSHIIMF